MMTQTEWIWGDLPPEEGWYAVLYCWEQEEGIFNDAAYWDGYKWVKKLPILGYSGPFYNELSAKEWAYEHDVEG